jgi:hypothetical protein
MSGEEVCGDAWAVLPQAGRSLIVMADGRGHGPCAAEVAQAAVRIVHLYPNECPAALLEHIHGALRGTRGAAVAVAEVHLERQDVTFVGIGNMGGHLIYADKSQVLLSQNGIVGHQMRTVRPLIYPWSDTALLLMYSDGLLSRWSLQPYPGLCQRHPSVIAGVLYRDYWRGRDDVSVVAAKARGGM